MNNVSFMKLIRWTVFPSHDFDMASLTPLDFCTSTFCRAVYAHLHFVQQSISVLHCTPSFCTAVYLSTALSCEHYLMLNRVSDRTHSIENGLITLISNNFILIPRRLHSLLKTKWTLLNTKTSPCIQRSLNEL